MSAYSTRTEEPASTESNTANTTHLDDLDIDEIHTRATAIQHMPTALLDVRSLFGVGNGLATKLREAGFSTIPDIHHTERWKLTLINGIGDETARGLKAVASSRCDYHFGNYAWEPFKEYEPAIARDR